METQMKETTKKLSDTIIAKVIEDIDSPYQQLRRKLKDIDVDYFEDISRDTEKIDTKLSLELKDKICSDFQSWADELLEKSGLKGQLITLVKVRFAEETELQSTDDYECFIEAVAKKIKTYAAQLLQTAETENITEAELKEKYEAARRITLKEKILRNNKQDVIDFYHALMERTWWECGNIVLFRISEFLTSLSNDLMNMGLKEIPAEETMKYVPQCADIDNIQLPEELTELAEQMAKNVHEEWAQERIRQGWTYGKERNDSLKQHPCLIPYEELPEEEKQFDRITSTKTLQFIISQGFKITRVKGL